MREIRTSGSEGGGTPVLPTPIRSLERNERNFPWNTRPFIAQLRLMALHLLQRGWTKRSADDSGSIKML